MTGFDERLAKCSGDRRKLLERLLQQEGVALPPTESRRGESAETAKRVGRFQRDPTAQEATLRSDLKTGKGKPATRDLYDDYHQRCDATIFGRHSFFMNLGYVENENRQWSPICLPPHFVNRNSATLALEVIGDVDLSGRRMLDVGCGRGGLLHLVMRFYRVPSAVGVDLSPEGIEFCRRQHRYENVEFVLGDAENLPFPEAEFDAVTNVESSHSYPNIFRFHREVHRVLRPGGVFLYADVFPTARLDEFRQAIVRLGFSMERDQDITANVLLSCADSADAQFEMFARHERDETMANALGVPDSRVYRDMKEGVMSFRILRFRKT